MSYTYISARVLPNTLGAQWIDIDIRDMLVYTVFAEYREIFLTLDNAGETVYADLGQLKAEYATYENKIAVLLLSIGARVLDEVTELPGKTVNYVHYSDAVRAGYSVSLTKRGVQYPENFPKSELTDLKIIRSGYNTDITLLHSHCLVSLNGFYHNTDTDGTHTYIVDGGLSVRKRGENKYGAVSHPGITSFYDVGELTKLSLDKDQLVPLPGHSDLKDSVVFNVPVSTENKSVLLVLGGYLVLPHPGTLWQVDDHHFAVNLNTLPFLERILESRAFINLDSLALTPDLVNPDNINLDELWSDAVIKRYFTLSQSYFVIVDRPSLFWNKVIIRQSLMPGLFTAYTEPTVPLIVGHGRAAEYWKVLENNYWAVTVMDSWYRNYIFNRQSEATLSNVYSQLAMDRPYFDSQGLLLEIGAL